MDCNNNINIMEKWDMRTATTTPGFMGDKRAYIVYAGFKTSLLAAGVGGSEML